MLDGLSVLLVGDRSLNRALIKRALTQELAFLRIDEPTDAVSFARCLAGGVYDLAITSRQLEWSDGFAVLQTIQSHHPHCPVIVLAGVESLESESVMGSSQSSAIVSRVLQAIPRNSLRTSEAPDFYRNFFDHAPVGFCRITTAGRFIEMNAAFLDVLGYPDRESLLPVNFTDLYVDVQERFLAWTLLEQDGQLVRFEQRLRRYGGEVIATRYTARSVCDATGIALYFDGIVEEAGPEPSPLIFQQQERIVGNREQQLDYALQRIVGVLEEAHLAVRVEALPSSTSDAAFDLGLLTKKEWAVLRRLLEGRRASDIALALQLSQNTIRNHIQAIFRKLKVHSQSELLAALGRFGFGSRV